jgi:transposase InsO family protein
LRGSLCELRKLELTTPLGDCFAFPCRSAGHKFQAKFHWHVEDLGIRHAHIKRGTPPLNGKVERSDRSDGQEFYQLLGYKGDVDLEAKLAEWERFYNFNKQHGAHNGKTPYEALREKL